MSENFKFQDNSLIRRIAPRLGQYAKTWREYRAANEESRARIAVLCEHHETGHVVAEFLRSFMAEVAPGVIGDPEAMSLYMPLQAEIIATVIKYNPIHNKHKMFAYGPMTRTLAFRFLTWWNNVSDYTDFLVPVYTRSDGKRRAMLIGDKRKVLADSTAATIQLCEDFDRRIAQGVAWFKDVLALCESISVFAHKAQSNGVGSFTNGFDTDLLEMVRAVASLTGVVMLDLRVNGELLQADGVTPEMLAEVTELVDNGKITPGEFADMIDRDNIGESIRAALARIKGEDNKGDEG